MCKIIGIDLGTTNSCVAVLEGGTPVVITNAEGARTTPSVVAFTKNGEKLVGDTAKRQAVTNTDRTVFSIKRKMGSTHRIKIDKKQYSPEDISAQILLKLKKDAESYLGEPVTKAVITVPAYFNNEQRQATKDAGRIAGLTVERIINEPTSAALAYGLDNGETQTILVYDLGGGTFDVSVIRIEDGVIQVLATSGNNHLGGDDFDDRIAGYLVKEFYNLNKIDISKDNVAMQRVREEAEKAKKSLSSMQEVNINLPFLATTKSGPVHMDMNLTRTQFNKLTADLVDKTAIPVQDALKDAGVSTGELNRVLLVGGSTRIPAVADKVRQLTGKEPDRGINPDECVALGAAIQGGKLAGDASLNEVLLMDVTPLSLSIETVGGIATRLIERNSTIPTRHSQIFTTAANFQSTVDIKVLQGERRFARENKLIGNFKLTGIKKAMRGVPQIEVTFDIDVNGIVKVSARDMSTGREQSIVITASSNLSESEIEQAIFDAQMNESNDNEKMGRVELYQDAQNMLFKAQDFLAANKKMLDGNRKAEIKNAVAVLQKSMKKVKPENMTLDEEHAIRPAKDNLEMLF